jgi:membrane protease subunit (stomatin/prohibitin family)
MNMLVSTIIDMLLGMILGMVASPIMMKAIKSLRQKRKVNRILREAADQQEKKDIDSNDDRRYRIL